MIGEGELAQLQPEEIPGERGQIFAAMGAPQVRSPSSLRDEPTGELRGGLRG